MKNWIMANVRYPKQDEQGRIKNVTERYMIDALSWTESEAKVYEEIGQRVMGEFSIVQMTKTKVVDIFEYPDNDYYYQCKVVYSVADADSGKEKKVTNLMLVTASNVKEAYERIHESLNNMLVTFEVPEIKLTKILEVFQHTKQEPIGFKTSE
ncbi:MAG: DUF4494 domain-containing protein [Roseivirga sp.]|nr:DUF4494 domain-containing protein [Roseivirga sp.]